MRVALSLLTYVPGTTGGSEIYVRELTHELRRSGVDLLVLVNPSAAGAWHEVPTSIGGRGGAGRVGKLLRLAEATLHPGRLRSVLETADVVHYPLTVALPSVGRPSVTTLHDLQHRDLPQLFTRATRRYRALAYDRAARSADLVIVPSAFVRERAIALLGLDPARIVAIHHGVDHVRFRPASDAREPFLLYPARPWPHKNHARLLAALELLRRASPELRLVLTGAGTETFAGRPGVEARGAVPPEELVTLYRRASCLVFPSLYEGFGLPLLEAMACGTPVAAARASAIPEVCGDAAVLFDPADAAAIASGVAEALQRTPELGVLGLRQAATFTWERAAAAHESAYRAVAA